MEKVEIERKFLLKSMPQIESSEVVDIDQYYFKNNGIWERARTWKSTKEEILYIHTIKRSISKGVNIEDEYFLTSEEFESFKNKCLENTGSKFISKQRWIYPQNELNWEVDLFKCGFNLIIAEIELPVKDYFLKLPDFIKDVMVMEVTGIKEFSNRSLAIKL
jgi:CYTH domain-containing protein